MDAAGRVYGSIRRGKESMKKVVLEGRLIAHIRRHSYDSLELNGDELAWFTEELKPLIVGMDSSSGGYETDIYYGMVRITIERLKDGKE